MIVDCDQCVVRGDACQDCVITVLLGAPPKGVEFDGTERQALDVLAEAGMVPHLQLVDRHAEHETTWVRADSGVHLRYSAERSATDDERPSQQVS